MKLEEIKELLEAVSQSDVAELELQTGKDKIRIRRSTASDSAAPQPPYVVVASGAGQLPAPAAGTGNAPAAPNPGANSSSAAGADAQAPDEDESLVMVPSPIVGTFYEASAPGGPAFVEIGDKVSKGQVLCIIEAMKLMNEIEAEVSGVVVKRFVQNAQPVEYGEALFAIQPS